MWVPENYAKKGFVIVSKITQFPSFECVGGLGSGLIGLFKKKRCTEILVCVKLWQCLKGILQRVTDGNGGADFEGHRSGGRASSNRRQKRALQK